MDLRTAHLTERGYIAASLAGVHLERGGRAVLRDITWTVAPGERWILAGANGAGKTQLLKLLAGSIWPTPARLRPKSAPPERRYLWRGTVVATPRDVQPYIAYVGAERQDKYERYGWNHTVEQVVGTGVHATDIPLEPLSARQRRSIAALLARLSIAHLAQRRFLSLSYGERRLALLARALAGRPRLLLLDELLNGLDLRNRTAALRWLNGLRRTRMPWVLATHRIDDVPASATHALVLERGRILYRGSLARAPLRASLGAPTRSVQARTARRSKTRAAREASDSRAVRGAPQPPRVRMTHASVYLEGHAVLIDVSLELRAGQWWMIHGANGAGKSTLLRTIYGEHSVAAGGRIERAGIEPGVALEVFRRNVGLVAPHLQSDQPQDLRVRDMVASGRYASIGLAAPPGLADRRATRRALASFGLARLAGRMLYELSYGQLRRALFARAWINEPELLLLDEPFAGLDVATRSSLQQRLVKLAAGGTTILMATHYEQEWPDAVTHELELRVGRVVYCGVSRRPADAARVALA
jgi:molybdate transport system ATP-binding protein